MNIISWIIGWIIGLAVAAAIILTMLLTSGCVNMTPQEAYNIRQMLGGMSSRSHAMTPQQPYTYDTHSPSGEYLRVYPDSQGMGFSTDQYGRPVQTIPRR